MKFDIFLTKLLSKTSLDNSVTINGVVKKIVGMSRYTTENMPDSQYLKIVFHDHSLMIVLISDQEIYYADKTLGKIELIPDDMVSATTEINFMGKDYEVVNKNDYQFVLQKYLGGINDIEGECTFSDYAPKEGSKAMLSLGIISHTGERADVYCEPINLNVIEI